MNEDVLTGRELVARFRMIRDHKNVSAQKLADATGIHRSVLANMENDRREKISVDEALAIATALEVNLLDCLKCEPLELVLSKVTVPPPTMPR